MPTTSRGYRYPGELDSADIAPYFQNLATDINNDIGPIAPRIKQVQRIGTGQSIPDSTAVTIVGFGVSTIQIGPSIAYTTGVFTVDFTGAVEVVLSVLWPTISAAHRTRLRILKNGAVTPDGTDTKWNYAGTGGQTGQEVISRVSVAAGDTISQDAYQDSGGSVTTVDDSTVFYIRRIG